MGLVSTWLNGIGLSSAVPTFQAAGIVTPAALAELDVAHFEALGISDPDERRKLFYLVQRIKMAVNKDKPKQDNSIEDQVDAVISNATLTKEEEPVETVASPSRSRGADNNSTPPASEPRRSRRLAAKKDVEISATKENRSFQSSPQKVGRTSTTDKATPGPMQPGSPSRSTRKTRSTATKAPKTASRKSRARVAAEQSQENPEMEKDGSRQREDRIVREEPEVRVHETKTSTKVKASARRSTASTKNVFNLQEDENDVELRTDSPSKRKSGLKKPRSVSSGRADPEPQDKEPVLAARRPESKLQNPGKSMRTGKRLSVIPSDTAAPMSPLVDMPMTKTENSSSRGRPRRDSSADSRGSRTSESSFLAALDDADEIENGENEQVTQQPVRTNRTRPKSIGTAEIMSSQNRSSSRPKARPSFGKHEPSIEANNRRKSDAALNRSIKKSKPFVHGGTSIESWSQKVEYLREDNAAEHELFQDQEDQDLYEFDMRIRVIVRKRPLSKAEASLSGGVDVIHPLDYGDYGRVLVYQPKTRVDLTKEIETIPFAYDNVYDESSTNIQIYQRSLRNLIQPFFRGQWSTIFAYGQTGSGKTYTMMGSNMTGINAGTAKTDEANFGLYYLAALDIFKMVKKPEYQHLTVQVSLFEIYGGKLFDLLNSRRQVKCLEDSKGKVCFPGLTEHVVDGPDDLMVMIEEGAVNRSTGTTSRNADSSRSHAVLQLKLRKDVGRRKNVEHGRLNFIDLAGSERGADTSSASRATRLEGAEINTSLLALKEVIRALATGGSMTHIPFRGSKLTQVLKDSFVGENSRCCMVACVSPDIASCEQTLNTLRYADRVKERDPETGALANGFDEPIRLSPLSSSLPSDVDALVSEDENVVNRISSTDEDDDFEAYNDDFEEPTDQATLDELLSSSYDQHTANVSEPVIADASGQQQAGAELISSHKAVMSKMLTMVKDEMTLVNTVDADRDGLDGYLVELERMQETQLDLISMLRKSLDRYVEACEAPDDAVQANAESDEESFEDLRDL